MGSGELIIGSELYTPKARFTLLAAQSGLSRICLFQRVGDGKGTGELARNEISQCEKEHKHEAGEVRMLI